MKTKKYIVLSILFLLPITVYLFFATGVNNFVKLPTITENITELTDFKNLDGDSVQLKNRITILGFFGKEVTNKKANAFNLAHKIYKKNYQFDEFQFVILIDSSQINEAKALKEQIKEIADPVNYQFAFGTPKDIEAVFNSLHTPGRLNDNLAIDWVFIIDKEGNLRGRNDDEDTGILYGYNAADYAEINNKMSDDVKVVLAEYRLALKKYTSDRQI
ncbi:MAG: hypothetical protein R2793_09500 [Flavobacteriaceae bacterium]